MSKYRTDDSQLASIFKALSNPHRLAIFRQLSGCCAPGTVCSLDSATRLCVGELGESLDIAPSTLSHHIKELNRAGLVHLQRRGKQVECSVDPGILQELASFFDPKLNVEE